MAPNRNILYIVLLALFQALSSTFLLRIPGFSCINSILFLLSGVLVSFLLVSVPEMSLSNSMIALHNRSQTWIKLATVAALLPIGYHCCRGIMDATPIAVENADMLPVIRIMGERFLQGEVQMVYEPIPHIWSGTQPIYPPVLWMSFLPALLLDFDMRWITVAGIYLCAILCLLPLQFTLKAKTIFSFVLLTALAGVLIWLHMDDSNNVIRLTEEGVVFFYYCLMAIAIVSGNAWLIGVAAALCLLSRFAIVGWLPCLAVYWLLNKKYSQLVKAFISGSVGVLLLLIIPFGWKPVRLFFSLPGKYIAHAQNVWETYPDHFNRSLGMAKFFGREGVEALHRCLLLTTFILPLLFVVFFLLRKGQLRPNNLLLASFNLTLTMFYNFIDVSYLYLYYTPVFVSLLIASFSIATQRGEGAEEKRMISSR